MNQATAEPLDLIDLQLRELVAFDALAGGDGNRRDVRFLLVSVRCGLHLVDAGFGDEAARNTLDRAHSALRALWDGRNCLENFPTDAAGMRHLRESLAIHESQRREAPRATLDRCIAASVLGL
jgi:hypothetical protein